jgi:integrase
MQFSSAINKYLIEVLRTKSKNHQRMTNQQLEYWSSKLGKTPSGQPRALSRITFAMIRDNIPQGVGPATRNRYLDVLSAFFNVCIQEWELIKENPVAKIRKFQEPRGRVRYLSTGERTRLLEACRASTHPYLYTIVVIALSTGMRKTEICTLTWNQIDLNDNKGLIYLTDTKNNERRMIPLTGHAYELVSNLQPAHSDKVFPGTTIRYAWYKAIRESKVEDFRFHDLRHTFCSYAAMQGVPLLTIATIVGHKDLSMTRRYSHLSVDHLRDTLEDLDRSMFG